ncbi:hypothetical protein HRG84_07720 [Flavisolibacter sp. BT320]|nr:hypothetical protein [Flavisolibacter longurius]
MRKKKFAEGFKVYLNHLPFDQSLNLAVRVCKDQFPEYTQFIKTSDCPGNDVELEQAIIAIQIYSTGRGNKSNLKSHLPIVYALEQQIQMFESRVSKKNRFEWELACEACEVVSYTLEFLLSQKSEPIDFEGILKWMENFGKAQ